MNSFKLDRSKWPVYKTRESVELAKINEHLRCKCTCHETGAIHFDSCCDLICPCGLKADRSGKITKEDFEKHWSLCYVKQQSVDNPKGRHKLK